ncbi:MAG TPA: 2OG-Fe(II) oxygenase [Candidatus Acidoferrum sp.]|nr:2OG-Fe(II) oxygenase [Candidatus Acidoferrum sp.]
MKQAIKKSAEISLQGPQASNRQDTALSSNLEATDWVAVEESLSARGYALTETILSAEECSSLISIYGDDSRFRSRIQMERFRFGAGDYKYFANPLPAAVETLRTAAYPHLARIANHWAEMLGDSPNKYPADHASFLRVCHAAGQIKPTPLLLHYEAGGYNCLHQDLYGEVSFPMQMVFLLGQPGQDWEGGEFLLVEQQPRAQSKAEVIHANRGQAIIFTTRYRPVKGTRGYYRVNLRHGVSRVRSGTRYTLGIIFHDAK